MREADNASEVAAAKAEVSLSTLIVLLIMNCWNSPYDLLGLALVLSMLTLPT